MDDDLEEICYDNLLAAIPWNEPLNSIEIWHKAERPTFRWTRFKRELKNFHELGFIEKIGLPHTGPQFYRWYDES